MKKIYKKNASILFISIFILSIFSGLGVFLFYPNIALTNSEITLDDNDLLKTSQIDKSDIKIAIYDEANISLPSYGAVTSALKNNNSLLETILNNAGIKYVELTTEDINNHELITSNFDVFILNDHLPRENIVNFVLEFWLGGGSILSFDSAVCFLCHFGILPPESDGDHGRGTYWDYLFSTTQNITYRHPISKEYDLEDSFEVSSSSSWATFDWSALSTTSIANDLTKIATIPNQPNDATVLAFDPSSKGGKVVHILSSKGISSGDDLIIDSIQWLSPKPKGRIAYDLTHQPRLGIDNWDDLAGISSSYFEVFRDEMVSRGYLFDKFYPSTTYNYSSTKLNKYDILIVLSPDLNMSSSERNILINWIKGGGSLLILGERPSGLFIENNKRVNLLLKDTGLKLNEVYGSSTTDNLIPNDNHPVTEGCNALSMSNRGAINITGNAFTLWKYTGDIHVAGEEYFDGRIILSSDINWFTDGQILDQDNTQAVVNIINWLSSTDSKILTYIAQDNSADPNDNVYKGPVSKALNYLSQKYYLTFTPSYFNLSLVNEDWDLVIIDNTRNALVSSYYNEILDYLKNGGNLILSTWEYRLSQAFPLWAYIGFKYAGNYFTTAPTVHLWNEAHPIFTTPVDYDTNIINTNLDYSSTDASNLTLYNNATAIAGLTSSSGDFEAAIILGANGRAIVNGFHVTEYSDDTDDSTYPDSLEIWMNEIYYMLPKSTTGGGIPGYDLIYFSLIAIGIIGLISILTYRNKLRKIE